MNTITIDRAVVEQALEALESSETTVQYEGFGMARRDAERKHQTAITALRAATAQQDEPVQSLPIEATGSFAGITLTEVRVPFGTCVRFEGSVLIVERAESLTQPPAAASRARSMK